MPCIVVNNGFKVESLWSEFLNGRYSMCQFRSAPFVVHFFFVNCVHILPNPQNGRWPWNRGLLKFVHERIHAHCYEISNETCEGYIQSCCYLMIKFITYECICKYDFYSLNFLIFSFFRVKPHSWNMSSVVFK